MRILVTGNRGQLGRQLMATTTTHEIVGADLPECDITDAVSVRDWLSKGPFDAVINAAAYTKVDAAESDESAALAVNAEGPGVLAAACREFDVLLCHISTDFVFPGDGDTPIDESAKPAPLSAYGRTKLEGELRVRDSGARHLIVRTSWLYGMDGPNFVLTMLRLARERGHLRVVADQFGSPTWTGDLAPALLRLIERRAEGTFHITNSGVTSWQGFAAEIVRQAGLAVPVDAITTAEFPTPARRPVYSALENRAWHDLGEPPLPEWQDALRVYLASRSLLEDAGQTV